MSGEGNRGRRATGVSTAINERLPTLPFVLHDLESYLLAAAHLVQILQPVAFLDQVLIAHCPSDVLHRVHPTPALVRDRCTHETALLHKSCRHSIAVKARTADV